MRDGERWNHGAGRRDKGEQHGGRKGGRLVGRGYFAGGQPKGGCWGEGVRQRGAYLEDWAHWGRRWRVGVGVEGVRLREGGEAEWGSNCGL